MKASAALLLGALLAAGVWAWTRAQEPRSAVGGTPGQLASDQPGERSADGSGPAAPALGDVGRERTGAESTAGAAGPGAARAPLSEAGVLLLRVSGVDEPARGELSWTPLSNDVLGRWSTYESTLDLFLLEQRQERLAKATTLSTADSSGWFRAVPPADLGDAGSVLWWTHPEHLPLALFAPKDAALWPRAVEGPPRSGSGARLRVVDGEGQPVPGAQIVRQALPRKSADFHDPSPEDLYPRALIRRAVTGADGWAELAPFGGPQRLEVRADAGWVQALLESDPQDLQLALAPTFEIRGSVSGASELGPWAAAIVEARGLSDEPWSPLVSFELGAAFDFGPRRLPIEPTWTQLRVRVAHGSVFAERIVSPPRPGDSLFVQLQAQPRKHIYALVRDGQSLVPVSGARLSLRERRGSWSFEGRSNRDGYIEIWGVPDAEVVLDLESEGYARMRFPWQLGSVPAGHAVPLDLPRPGSLSVQVTRNGEPLEEFQLVVHSFELPEAPRLVQRDSDATGALVISDLEPGEYTVHARAPGALVSSGRGVRIREGQTAELELPLQNTRRVGVQVLDAASREPIAGARARVFLMDGPMILEQVRESAPSSAAGRIDLDGVPLEHVRLQIASPGYLLHSVEVPRGSEGGETELGTVALEIAHSIALHLEVEDGSPTDYRAEGLGRDGAQAFGSDGILVLEREHNDDHLFLHHPGGIIDVWRPTREMLAQRKLRILVPKGAVWLDVLGTEDRALSGELSWRDPELGWARRAIRLQEGTSQSFPSLNAEDLRLRVAGTNGRELASQQVRRLASGGWEARVTLGEPLRRVLVVDPDGQPVAGVWVRLEPDGLSAEIATTDGRTDERGEADLFGPADRPALAWLFSDDGAMVVQRRVHVPPAGETLRLVMDATRSLRVRVRGDGAPIALADVHLQPPLGRRTLQRGTTDPAGLWRGPVVGPDPLHIEVRAEGFWPHGALHQPGADGGEVEVDLLRTGSLTIEVVDGEGQLVPGAALSLVHRSVRQHDSVAGPLGGDVAAWMSAGLVPQSRLETDGSGRVALQGVPRGWYELRVSRHGASAVEQVALDGPHGFHRVELAP